MNKNVVPYGTTCIKMCQTIVGHKEKNISKSKIILCFSDTLFGIEKSYFILRLFYKVKQLFDTSLFFCHQTSPWSNTTAYLKSCLFSTHFLPCLPVTADQGRICSDCEGTSSSDALGGIWDSDPPGGNNYKLLLFVIVLQSTPGPKTNFLKVWTFWRKYRAR